MAGKLINNRLALFLTLVAIAKAHVQGSSTAWKKFSSVLKEHFREGKPGDTSSPDTIPTRVEGT